MCFYHNGNIVFVSNSRGGHSLILAFCLSGHRYKEPCNHLLHINSGEGEATFSSGSPSSARAQPSGQSSGSCVSLCYV